MRKSLITLLTAASVASGVSGASAVETRPGAANLRAAFSLYDGSSSQTAPAVSQQQPPLTGAGYQTFVSDEPVGMTYQPSEMTYAPLDSAACDCATGCECGSCAQCGDNSCWLSRYENCTLESLLGMDCCDAWNIGGWGSIGYSDNNIPLSQSYNDLLSFNDVPDHLHVNQAWLYFEKTTDGSCGCDYGGRFDVMYGTDAQKTQAFGNPRAGVRNQGAWDASLDNAEYGWAMPQLYAEVAYHDLSVKVGHFFTLIGYEVVPVTGNFFRSHSYTKFNSEPFTHTGAVATYAMNDCTTLYGGWVLGWDTGFDQLNSGNAFLGGISRKLGDSQSLTYMATYGNFGWRDGGSDNSYSHSVVYVSDINDCWQYVLQSDYIRTDNPGESQYETIGAVNYLFYKLSDKAKVGGRYEWWKADGVSYNEVTGGVNLWAADNIVVRPEYRQDWAPAIGLDEGTFAVDMIVTF